MHRQSDAVKKAIKQYNNQAELLDPPTLPISWEEIVEYAFVGEFDILCITWSDIWQEKWTKKSYRDATMKYYKLSRAQEEIKRLNIEVGWLRSFIYKETEHTEHVIEEISHDKPSWAAELCRWWILQSSVNRIHLQCLRQFQCEPYYTGSQDSRENTESLADIFASGSASSHSLEEEMKIEAENEQERDFEVMTDFVTSIAD